MGVTAAPMENHRRTRRGPITRNAQIGGGQLHIAHALWGGALMMLALLIGWLTVKSRDVVYDVVV